MTPVDSALIAAAVRGDAAAIRDLVARGANVDAQDARGRTALLAATHANRVEAARALIRAGADVNRQDAIRDNPFLFAAAEGRLEILRLLIAAGANTRLTNRYGGTGLIPAAHHGHVEVVRELLTRTDVDVNHVNNLGWTALLEAVILGDGGPRHQEIVRLLVRHGANAGIPDRGGLTPLRHAESRGFAEIARILRAAGAR
jgi:ankyrin repeat protein